MVLTTTTAAAAAITPTIVPVLIIGLVGGAGPMAGRCASAGMLIATLNAIIRIPERNFEFMRSPVAASSIRAASLNLHGLRAERSKTARTATQPAVWASCLFVRRISRETGDTVSYW